MNDASNPTTPNPCDPSAKLIDPLESLDRFEFIARQLSPTNAQLDTLGALDTASQRYELRLRSLSIHDFLHFLDVATSGRWD